MIHVDPRVKPLGEALFHLVSMQPRLCAFTASQKGTMPAAAARDGRRQPQDRSVFLHFYFAYGDYQFTVPYIVLHILFTIIGAVVLAFQLGVLEVHWPPPAIEGW